ALEVDARAAARFGQPARVPQRRWTPGVLTTQRVELGVEVVVCARVGEGLLQLIERVHQGFGDVFAAEAAEMASGVGIGVHGWHRARSLAATPGCFRRKNDEGRALRPSSAKRSLTRTRNRRWSPGHQSWMHLNLTERRRCR